MKIFVNKPASVCYNGLTLRLKPLTERNAADMTKTILSSSQAPAAVGPYSHGVAVSGTLVFLSGQLPIDPATGAFAEGGIRARTRQSLTNLRSVLAEAGADLSHVIKTTVFLQNMDDFAAMNEEYASFFTGDFPARSAVEVARIPKGALVEIEAVAVI